MAEENNNNNSNSGTSTTTPEKEKDTRKLSEKLGDVVNTPFFKGKVTKGEILGLSLTGVAVIGTCVFICLEAFGPAKDSPTWLRLLVAFGSLIAGLAGAGFSTYY
jgi:hypothetical protein